MGTGYRRGFWLWLVPFFICKRGEFLLGEKRKRYSGSGGIAEAGGTIPWLIIKMVQGIAKMLRRLKKK